MNFFILLKKIFIFNYIGLRHFATKYIKSHDYLLLTQSSTHLADQPIRAQKTWCVTLMKIRLIFLLEFHISSKSA